MTWDAPDSFDEAVAWFRDRLPISDGDIEDLEAFAGDQAFTVAGVAQLDVVTDVWEAIETALTTGTDLDDFKAAIADRLEAAWAGSVDNPPARIDTIFRTNLQSSYAAGRYQQMTDPAVAKHRPYWLFDAVVDKDTSEICKVCASVCLPADDPWWETHYPPLHFNCRSVVTTLTEDQADKRGVTRAPPHELPQAGFGKSPGAAPWTPEKADYPAPLWSAFQDKDDDE